MSAAPDAVPTPFGHDGIVTCPVCTWANPCLARFCGSCGMRLLVFCWSCGTGARVGQPYCENCGSQLVLPQASLTEQGGRLPLAEDGSPPSRPTMITSPAGA